MRIMRITDLPDEVIKENFPDFVDDYDEYDEWKEIMKKIHPYINYGSGSFFKKGTPQEIIDLQKKATEMYNRFEQELIIS